jgi:hypothetical protein
VTTIDCKGKTLMPGLTDAHVHICAVEGNITDQHRFLPPSLLAAYAPNDGILIVARVLGGLGRGAQSAIEEQVKSAGTNMININAGNFQQGGVRMGQGNASTLTPEDALAIRDVPGVQYVGIPEFQDVGNRCTEQFSSVIAGQTNIDAALSACQDIASQVGG